MKSYVVHVELFGDKRTWRIVAYSQLAAEFEAKNRMMEVARQNLKVEALQEP